MLNRYKLSDDGTHIIVFFKNGGEFLIDQGDYALVARYTWYRGKRGYPVMHSRRKTRTLHRVLLDDPAGFDVDHVSGDKLDNRRSNLRICTHQENMRNQKKRNTNTSGYMGVSHHRGVNKYEAYVHHEGKKHYLGLFPTAREAALARDKAAHKLFGQYARPNFPIEAGDFA